MRAAAGKGSCSGRGAACADAASRQAPRVHAAAVRARKDRAADIRGTRASAGQRGESNPNAAYGLAPSTRAAAWGRRPLVAALDEQARIAQGQREGRLDASRFRTADVLQVQRRTGEHLEPALEHAAGGMDAGLVLIEALGGGVGTHAHVEAERA